MALCKSVTKHKDVPCELYADTYSEVADECENKSWTASVSSPQQLHVNNCDLSFSLYL